MHTNSPFLALWREMLRVVRSLICGFSFPLGFFLASHMALLRLGVCGGGWPCELQGECVVRGACDSMYTIVVVISWRLLGSVSSLLVY